ncbi:MAG: biotin-dependent carboxyltransferase family protein [Salibacteraceae bacterium]
MMLNRIHVLRPGQFTTVQDGGRRHHRRRAYPQSGAMDLESMRWANSLVGNALDAPTLEFTLVGGALRFEQPATLALTGAPVVASLNQAPVVFYQRFLVPAGGTLDLGPMQQGMRTYLAIGGQLAASPILGSWSTYIPGKFGGFEGRSLQVGDTLLWETVLRHEAKSVQEHRQRKFSDPALIRTLPGPEWNAFSDAFQRSFLAQNHRVTFQSDRMGIRLESDAAAFPFEGPSMLSSPTFPGTVQLPESGKAVVLMADGQTTGGYPRILQVIEADLGNVAQARPGASLRFKLVAMEEALEAQKWVTFPVSPSSKEGAND